MRSFLIRVFSLHGVIGLCLIALTIPTYRLIDAERQNVGAIPREVEKQGDLTRQWLTKNVTPVLRQLSQTIGEVPSLATGLIDKHATKIEGTLDATRDDLNRQVGTALVMLNGQLDALQAKVTTLQSQVNPVLAAAQSTLEHTDKTVTDLHPQFLGLIAASKVTMGQAALTMRDIQTATPAFISNWDQISQHVNVMSDAGAKSFVATQHTMENFAAASKPLPTWLRIALGVGPPVAQMGAATVAAGSLLGWFK
jgi:hypothetical protein